MEQRFEEFKKVAPEFAQTIEVDPDFEYLGFGEHEEDEGHFIKNLRFSTVTHFTEQALAEYKLPLLLATCIQGKDIDYITRVTGYMGKVSGWNKGKKAELRDRHRTMNRDF